MDEQCASVVEESSTEDEQTTGNSAVFAGQRVAGGEIPASSEVNSPRYESIDSARSVSTTHSTEKSALSCSEPTVVPPVVSESHSVDSVSPLIDSASRCAHSTSRIDSVTPHVDSESPCIDSAVPCVDSPSPPVDLAAHEYCVKWVETQGALQPLITQSMNGPCPLLALVNAMLLRGKLQLPADTASVAGHRLLEHVGNLLVDGASGAGRLTTAGCVADLERNVQDALAVLPKLLTGLDVNVQFTGVSNFEYTPELVIFDLMNVALYHGWLPDPADRWRCDAVSSYSYNRLVELIVANKHSDNTELISQALVAEEFLEETASQITEYGLSQLQQKVREGEVAVLFRNNHFNTIYKYQGVLYSLVTDQGFLSETDIVWETLVSPRMPTRFVNGEFAALPVATQKDVEPSSSILQRTDLDIALELQSQEYAREDISPVTASSQPLHGAREQSRPLPDSREQTRSGHQVHQTSPARSNKSSNNTCSVM